MAVNWGGRKEDEFKDRMGDPNDPNVTIIDEHTDPKFFMKKFLLLVRPGIKSVDGHPHPYNWWNITRGKVPLVNIDDIDWC